MKSSKKQNPVTRLMRHIASAAFAVTAIAFVAGCATKKSDAELTTTDSVTTTETTVTAAPTANQIQPEEHKALAAPEKKAATETTAKTQTTATTTQKSDEPPVPVWEKEALESDAAAYVQNNMLSFYLNRARPETVINENAQTATVTFNRGRGSEAIVVVFGEDAKPRAHYFKRL